MNSGWCFQALILYENGLVASAKNQLAMSLKKKRRREVADKKASKKFFTIVGISVLLLMLLLYLMFQGMS